MKALALLLALASPPQDFQQGPERVGQVVHVSGRVIGWRGECALVMADRPGEAWQGLGGAGRFYWCDDTQASRIDGEGLQVGTRWARVGPRWRVLPVYEPAQPTHEGLLSPR